MYFVGVRYVAPVHKTRILLARRMGTEVEDGKVQHLPCQFEPNPVPFFSSSANCGYEYLSWKVIQTLNEIICAWKPRQRAKGSYLLTLLSYRSKDCLYWVRTNGLNTRGRRSRPTFGLQGSSRSRGKGSRKADQYVQRPGMKEA